jgi:hypothetical protein
LLIREKLSPRHIYPQLTQLPANYADFLAAFRDGQTVDNKSYLTIANTLQTSMYKTALGSGHLTTRGNPIQGESLVDIFLTDKGVSNKGVIPSGKASFSLFIFVTPSRSSVKRTNTAESQMRRCGNQTGIQFGRFRRSILGVRRCITNG